MTETEKNSKSAIYQQIHNVLLNEWDPIEVKNIHEAQDEYDPFVYTVYSLLEAGATEEQVYETLKIIALEDMGVPASSNLDDTSRKAAKKLIELDIKEPTNS